jgi:hypothetical protein
MRTMLRSTSLRKGYRPAGGLQYVSGLAALTVIAEGIWADVVGAVALVVLLVILVWLF